MKILLINKFYHDGSKSGGVGRHILELEKILKKDGHAVIPFSCLQPETKDNPYLDYFPSYFDLEKVDFSREGIKKACKIFYNREATQKLEKLILDTQPDIAHIHNIYHHLSAPILKVLKKHNIPVVMTVHDYKLICPEYNMYVRGKIYEKCQGGKFYRCFIDRCIKNSYLASLLLTLEAYFTKFKKYYHKNVDVYLTPSLFMKKKLTENGYDKKKIIYLPNFINIDIDNTETPRYNHGASPQKEKYFVFSTRLVKNKGGAVLIKALKNSNLKGYRLKIAGDGEERKNLEKLASDLGVRNKIDFLGHLSQGELKNILEKALFSVVPSVWYENAPYSVLESYLAKTAVIGSNMGGIPELIIDEKTGFVFESGNGDDLAMKISYLINNPQIAKKMGEKAQEFLRNKLSPAVYLNKILIIYNSLIER